jgi:hypothetical protein
MWHRYIMNEARMMRVSITVSEARWTALKGQAKAEGRFLSAMIDEAFRAYLHGAGEPAPPTPTTPAPSLDSLKTQWGLKSGREVFEEAEGRVARKPSMAPPTREELRAMSPPQRLRAMKAYQEWARENGEPA